MIIIEWVDLFCYTFYHILRLQIGYCYYTRIYRCINVCNGNKTEYLLIALGIEIEFLSI